MNHVNDTPCGNTCYKIAKKQVNSENEKHMDLYFATCKLKVVEIQDSVVDIQVVFVETQGNFNQH